MNNRELLRRIVRALFRLLMYVQVSGLEHMPKHGACLVCINHLAVYDPAVLFVFSGREDITALVAKKHLKNPLFRYLVNQVGGIWLNRDDADTQAIRAAMDFLEQGGCLGISPEGTRSPTHALVEGKIGAAYLADKARVPIVPVAIINTDRVTTNLFHLRRPRIEVVFGEPFMLPPIERKERDVWLRRNTDEIMCQIAARLPQRYWGVYQNHPRLKELIQGS